MAQYYTDKQTIINLILTEQPELKHCNLRISLYMYFLFCLYIKLTSPVKEQIGIIEQDNFYPKYLFEPNWYYNTYGPRDESFDFDPEDTSYEWNQTSFDLEILQFLVNSIHNNLKNHNDFQLVDRWLEEPYVIHYHANKNNDNQKVTINLEDIYDLWSQPEINTQRR